MKETYQHYFKHPYSKFKDYFKVSLRDFGFSRKMFSHLVDFNNNKKLNKIDRNIKMKRLIDLQNSNKFEFENVFISELRSLYHFDDHSKFEIPEFIGSIQSTYYRNPFSKRIIVLLDSKKERFKPIQCCRMRDKHLHSDFSNISFIDYSEENFKIAADIINIAEDSPDYHLFKHFIILHEMAHDTDYQNYMLFKDYSEGFPILAETYCMAENDADILAILYLIKHYSMEQQKAKDLIQMILKFRSVINKDKYIEKIAKIYYVDSEFKHLTEPSLLILLGLVCSKSMEYFFNLTTDDMILLSMRIIEKSRCRLFRKNCYSNMLPLNSEEFFEDVLSEKFQTLFSYYLVSIYGYDKVMETSKLPYEDQLTRANKFKEILIKKLYDPIFDEVNADFRLKVSFEYSLLSDDDYYWLFELKFFEDILKEM
jgi:hypothetical protein